jgi:hypothetical protein
MKKITILAAASLLSVTAHAGGFWTANQLLTRLQSTNTFEQGAAYGYIAGVHDLGDRITHCGPAGITLQQVVDLTRRELVNRPESRHNSADIYVVDALSKAWPCKKRGEKSL